MIVVRLMGPHDYGIIGITLAIGSTFTIFQHLGLGVGVAKEAAQVKDERHLGPVSVLVLAIRYALLLPLLAVMLFIAAPKAVIAYQLPQLEYLLWLYSIFIILSSPGDILGNVLTGANRFKPFFALRLINELILTIAVCAMIWSLGVEGYFWGQAIAGGIYTLLSGLIVWRIIGRRIAWLGMEEIKVLIKSIFKTSIAIYVAKLLRSFSLQLPVLLAGLYLPVASVGLLKFGMQAGGFFANFLAAAQTVTLPRMTRYYSDHGEAYLIKQYGSNFKRFASGAGILLVSAITMAPEAVVIVGGNKFILSTKIFQYIVLFYVFVVLADNIFSGIHFPLSREGAYILSYVVYFVVALVGTLFFTLGVEANETAVMGLCIGALVHFAVALLQTRQYPDLMPVLVKSGIKLCLIAAVASICILLQSLAIRILIGCGCLAAIALDAWNTDDAVRRLVPQGIQKIKARLRT